jgi:methyl-accepting chemotaxis protein
MSLKRYRNWPVMAKIMVIPVLTIIVIFAGVELVVIPMGARQIMEDKQEATRQVVEVAYGVLESFERQARDGQVPAAAAQEQARKTLKELRYNKKEYFWVNDLGKPLPKMVMHPTVPALDGKVLDDAKFNKATRMRDGLNGPEKKLADMNLFLAFNEVVERAGHGYVNYDWPKPKEGGGATTELYPKLSYVKLFKPWGWVVGSGVYVDDVRQEAAAIRFKVYAIALGCALVMLLLAFVVSRDIHNSFREVIDRLVEMASGDADLTQRLEVKRQDESGDLAEAFNRFLDNLQKIIGMVMQNATKVAQASVDMRVRSEAMAGSAERVAMDAMTVATASEEMSATSGDIAVNCSHAVEASQRTSGFAGEGAAVVNNTIAVMDRIADQVRASASTVGTLGERSNQIGAIVGTIQDIADQTNLLALNAAIEAARAGEQGRGFAVVADEVRALAERTSKATKEISDMIRSIQVETQGAVEAMNRGVLEVHGGTAEAARSGEALNQILAQVDQVTLQINQIATAAEEQTATTGEISSNIARITDDARSSSHFAQETTRAAEELNRLAEALISAVDRFRTIVKWNSRMSINVRQFDEQHMKLVEMIQQLNGAMKNGEGKAAVGEILTGLVQYAETHLKQEEEFLTRNGYPDFTAHKQIHDNLRTKLGEMVADFEGGRAVPSAIMMFLSDWLVNHIMGVDKKYGVYMNGKGIS